MLRLNCEGVAGNSVSISTTAAGYNSWAVISDVDHINSRFCILFPSPAIKVAKEINARVACYV